MDDFELNISGLDSLQGEPDGLGEGAGPPRPSRDRGNGRRGALNRKKFKEFRERSAKKSGSRVGGGGGSSNGRPKQTEAKAAAPAREVGGARPRERRTPRDRPAQQKVQEEQKKEVVTAAPRELPRIYSHAQATTTTTTTTTTTGSVPSGRRGPPPSHRDKGGDDGDLDEVNSDIDEEAKGFLDELLSGHFEPDEAEPGGGGPRGDVEPLNENARNFADVGLDQSLVNCLLGMGFEAPTGIQRAAVPLILSGKDVLAQSPTGSGKTVAYLSPIAQMLKQRASRVSRSEGALAIVIVPTRELSLQVFQVASRLLKDFYWIVPGTIMGGEKRSREKARLRKGINVLTCTPGRLLDHLENTEAFQCSDLRYLVLDEADRLVDMGFEEQVSKIIKLLDRKAEQGDRSSRRQTVMLSATMHSGVTRLARFSLNNPESVGFDPDGSGEGGAEGGREFKMPEKLRQSYLLVPTKLRPVILYKLVSRCFSSRGGGGAPKAKAKVVVFVSCCDSVEFHHQILCELAACDEEGSLSLDPSKAFKLHGNLTQKERTAVYFDFCDSDSALLVCTDVTARGLDFPSVTHIIQYDPPGEAEDYIHRVGRTARIGQEGESFLFLLPQEMPYVDVLRGHGVAGIEEIPVGTFLGEEAQRKNFILLQKVGALYRDPVFVKMQRLVFEITGSSDRLKGVARDAYRSHIRAYRAYPKSMREIFSYANLHTGHVADSFGLNEKPSLIGRSHTKEELKRKKAEHARSLGRKKAKQAPGGSTSPAKRPKKRLYNQVFLSE